MTPSSGKSPKLKTEYIVVEGRRTLGRFDWRELNALFYAMGPGDKVTVRTYHFASETSDGNQSDN